MALAAGTAGPSSVLVNTAQLASFMPPANMQLVDEAQLYTPKDDNPRPTYVPPPASSDPTKDRQRLVQGMSGTIISAEAALRGIAGTAERTIREVLGPGRQHCSDINRLLLADDPAAPAVVAYIQPAQPRFTVPFLTTDVPRLAILLKGPNGYVVPNKMCSDTGAYISAIDPTTGDDVGLVASHAHMAIQPFGGGSLSLVQIYKDVELVFLYGTPEQYSVFADLFKMPPMLVLNGIYGVNVIAHPEVRMTLDICNQRAHVRPISRPNGDFYLPLDCLATTGEPDSSPAAFVLATLHRYSHPLLHKPLRDHTIITCADSPIPQAPAQQQAPEPATEPSSSSQSVSSHDSEVSCHDSDAQRLQVAHPTSRPQSRQHNLLRLSPSEDLTAPWNSLLLTGRFQYVMRATFTIFPGMSESLISPQDVELLRLAPIYLEHPRQVNLGPGLPTITVRWKVYVPVKWTLINGPDPAVDPLRATVKMYVTRFVNNEFTGGLGTNLLRRTGVRLVWDENNNLLRIHPDSDPDNGRVLHTRRHRMNLSFLSDPLPPGDPPPPHWRPDISRASQYSPHPGDMVGRQHHGVLPHLPAPPPPHTVYLADIRDGDATVALRLRPHQRYLPLPHLQPWLLAQLARSHYGAAHVSIDVEREEIQLGWYASSYPADIDALLQSLRPEWEEVPLWNPMQAVHDTVFSYSLWEPLPADRPHNIGVPPVVIPEFSAMWDPNLPRTYNDPLQLAPLWCDADNNALPALWLTYAGNSPVSHQIWENMVVDWCRVTGFYQAQILVTGIWIAFTTERWRNIWYAVMRHEQFLTDWNVTTVTMVRPRFTHTALGYNTVLETLVYGVTEEPATLSERLPAMEVEEATEELTEPPSPTPQPHTPSRSAAHNPQDAASRRPDEPNAFVPETDLDFVDESQPEPADQMEIASQPPAPPSAPPEQVYWMQLHVPCPGRRCPARLPDAVAELVPWPTVLEWLRAHLPPVLCGYAAQRVLLYESEDFWIQWTGPDAQQHSEGYLAVTQQVGWQAIVYAGDRDPPPDYAESYSQDTDLPDLGTYTGGMVDMQRPFCPNSNPGGNYPNFPVAWIYPRRPMTPQQQHEVANQITNELGCFTESTVLGIAVQHPSRQRIARLIARYDTGPLWRACALVWPTPSVIDLHRIAGLPQP